MKNFIAILSVLTMVLISILCVDEETIKEQEEEELIDLTGEWQEWVMHVQSLMKI